MQWPFCFLPSRLVFSYNPEDSGGVLSILVKFSCLDQFLCMVFAQLTYRESLRDTETCLRAVQSKLYHVGIRGRVSRSTLADANETRDWRIWADFAQVLVGRARQLYAGENFGLALQQSAYALDSTTIDLCLSLFPWARFRRRKGGIKVHTLMDLRGSIPCFIRITAANVHDVNILDELLLQPGAFYVMDRAYTDFARLYTFTRSFGLLRGSRQKQSPLLPKGLPPRRQVHRPTQRSHNPSSRAENLPSLSRYASPHQLRRYRYPEALGLLDQQLFPSTPDHCPTFTSAAGVWSCSSNGSNNTCGSRPFWEPPKTPSKPRSGSPSAFTYSWPSSRRN